MPLRERLSLLITTLDSQERARRLARELLENRLVGCVQIDGPIESHYHWNGAIESAAEWRVMLKTIPELADAAKLWLSQHHPYTTPQIIELTGDAADAYLNWLTENVKSP